MRSVRRTFKPGWALTFQAAAAVATVLALAGWQLARGLEKSALAAERLARLSAPPVAMDPRAAPNFTRLALAGRYDAERHFLLAARGEGILVWTPLRTAAGTVLVNRGWHGNESFETPVGPVAVVAVAWPKTAASRASSVVWPAGWPKRLFAPDLPRMAAAVDAAPREVRLWPGSAGVLAPPTLAWDYSPGTHYGYVAQWLLIGAALAAGYVVIGRRRGRAADGAEPHG